MAALTSTLRVASWNIREGVPADSSNSEIQVRDEVVSLLMSRRVDIIGLQEVPFDQSARSWLLNIIQDHTPLGHIAYNVLSESSFQSNCRAGVALASRFPLTDCKPIQFNNPELRTELQGNPIRTYDKGLVSATVLLEGQDISIVSLHTFPFHLFGRDADESAFRQMWTDLSAELDRLRIRPLIVCGDFNTSKRDLVIGQNGRTLSRAVINEPTHRGQPIDDVLYSKEFKAVNVEVISNFSDHRICITDLEIECSA